VKKILLFFVFILLLGCDSLRNNDNEIAIINCPEVFFSSENNVFAQGDIESLNLDKIQYKAALNNHGFLNNCFVDKKNNNYLLDLLILVDPINPKDQNINLPIFVLIYDEKDRIIDKHYFRIFDSLSYNENISDYQLTEVKVSLKIVIDKNKEAKFFTVGFVKLK